MITRERLLPFCFSKLIAAFILVVSISVYLNTLSNGFVYDDNDLVLNNRYITSTRYLPDIFSQPVFAFREDVGAANYYRPMLHLIGMAEYHIFGFRPWGWHLVNIIFHTINAIMVFLIAFSLFTSYSSPPPSHLSLFPFVAALLFATHPIHTEAVAWVAGISEVSVTFFYLLSFYLYIKSELKSLYLLSVASFFMATLSKETALTLPFLIVAYDYSKMGKNLTRNWRRYIPYIIVIILYIGMRTYGLYGVVPKENTPPSISTYQWLINIPPIVIQYIGKLLVPIKLNALYVVHIVFSITEPKAVISFFLVFFAGVAVIFFKKNKIIWISLAWIFITLLPVLYLPGLSPAIFAERYLYLPSIGFAILLSYIFQQAWYVFKASRFINALLVLVILLLVGFYSTVTINRNAVWHDDYALWSDTIKKSPDSADANYNFGVSCYNKGLFDKAISSYKRALLLFKRPLDIKNAYNNLGNAYANKGLLNEAIMSYKEALRIDPQDSIVLHNFEIVSRKIQSGD